MEGGVKNGRVRDVKKNKKVSRKTCDDMAKLINVSTRAYSNKEKGITQFKLYEMVITSQHFGKPMEEIFLNQ